MSACGFRPAGRRERSAGFQCQNCTTVGNGGDAQSSLRVIAVPSEHGGVQYMMSLEKDGQKDDKVVTMDGLNFLVDSDSGPFLEEATIDYVEDFPRAGFVISNPAFAAAGCACD